MFCSRLRQEGERTNEKWDKKHEKMVCEYDTGIRTHLPPVISKRVRTAEELEDGATWQKLESDENPRYESVVGESKRRSRTDRRWKEVVVGHGVVDVIVEISWLPLARSCNQVLLRIGSTAKQAAKRSSRANGP